MGTVNIFDGAITVTFNKATLRSECKALDVASVINLTDLHGTFGLIASGFIDCFPRTEDVTLNEGGEDNPDAIAFYQWFTANKNTVDYLSAWESFEESCSVNASIEWRTAYNTHESAQIGLNKDPDLKPVDEMPPEALDDPEVKKKETIIEVKSVAT